MPVFYYTHSVIKIKCESDSSDDYSYEPKRKLQVIRIFLDVSDDEIEARCVNE